MFTPAALTSGGSATAVSGVATFGSIVHGTDGTYTMTASSSGLTSSSASSPYTITTVTFITGDYRTNPALGNLGLVFFSSTAALTTRVAHQQ
ncbi:MAG: hypothetical protein IPI52_16025 [Bacteroidetes bacterium]|nr:hypothetical protein [Bacteroidota bacterium]